MENKWILPAAIILLFCANASGTEIYIANSEAGTADGASCENAYPLEWLSSAANWGSEQGKIGPGTTVHLCGTIGKPINILGSGQPGSPITILFEPDAKMSAPYWSAYIPPFYTRGLPNDYTTKEIAAIYIDKKDYITIDGGQNGAIEATGTGFDNNYSFSGVFGRGNNVEIKNLAIRDMYKRIRGSGDYWTLGTGISFWGSNLSIHDNNIANAFYCLISGSESPSFAATYSNIEIFRNELSGCGVELGVAMSSDRTTLSNVSIHHNRIYGGAVWDGYLPYNPFDPSRTMHRRDFIKIWGRAADLGAVYSGLRIYNNVIGPGLTKERGATGWIVASDANYSGVDIHNNLLLSSVEDGHSAFIEFSGSSNALTSPNLKIRNNTFIGNNKNDPIHLGRKTVGHEIYGNIFYNYSLAFYAMDINTEIAFWNNNSWYPLRGPGSFQYKDHHASAWGIYPPYRWAEWKGQLGFDTLSINEDPGFSDMSNPAGTDGIFFTNDDGFSLQQGSVLCTNGRNGGSIGAYACAGPPVSPPPQTDNDLDGVPDAIDRCPDTSSAARPHINIFGCAMPIATKFDIKPDFNATDINGMHSLEIGISAFGKISYAGKNILLVKITAGEDDRLDIDADLNISQGKITLNQNNLSQLNQSATITLYNTSFTNPKILRDGEECTACKIAAYDRGAKTLVFTAPGF